MVRCEQLESRSLLAFMPVNVIGPGFFVPDETRAPRRPAVQVAPAASAPAAGSLAARAPSRRPRSARPASRLAGRPFPAPRSTASATRPATTSPAPAGRQKIVDVAATSTSLTLSNLRPFTLYSIDVSAVPMTGAASTTHVNAWTAKPASTQRFLYTFHLAKSRQGFQNLEPHIEVYDIENGHQWVKNIPLPAGIYNVRSIARSADGQGLRLVLRPLPGRLPARRAAVHGPAHQRGAVAAPLRPRRRRLARPLHPHARRADHLPADGRERRQRPVGRH